MLLMLMIATFVICTVYYADACGILICLSWESQNENIILICKITNVKYRVEFMDPAGEKTGMYRTYKVGLNKDTNTIRPTCIYQPTAFSLFGLFGICLLSLVVYAIIKKCNISVQLTRGKLGLLSVLLCCFILVPVLYGPLDHDCKELYPMFVLWGVGIGICLILIIAWGNLSAFSVPSGSTNNHQMPDQSEETERL